MTTGQFCTLNESGTCKALSPRRALQLGDVAIYGNSWGRTPKAHGNVRWEVQDVCFPESSWVGAPARQGLTAKAGHWLVAWAGGKTGMGTAGWCPGQRSGALSQALLGGG